MILPEAVSDKMIDVGTIVIKNGSLDTKTKILCAISSSIASYCTHCHGQFRDMARKSGLTDKQISEAEAIGMRIRQKCSNESGFYSLTP